MKQERTTPAWQAARGFFFNLSDGPPPLSLTYREPNSAPAHQFVCSGSNLPEDYLAASPARTAQPAECTWLTVARQVVVGEFVGADSSTVESVFIGLRHLAWHPTAHAALRRLAGEPACLNGIRDAIRTLTEDV
jgi:hypothetical protein